MILRGPMLSFPACQTLTSHHVGRCVWGVGWLELPVAKSYFADCRDAARQRLRQKVWRTSPQSPGACPQARPGWRATKDPWVWILQAFGLVSVGGSVVQGLTTPDVRFSLAAQCMPECLLLACGISQRTCLVSDSFASPASKGAREEAMFCKVVNV